MKIEIKCPFRGTLFSHDAKSNSMRLALEAAISAGADLGGANLHGVRLANAYLVGANLAGANLTCANLGGADLGGANLHGVRLANADLAGANLAGARLAGANLANANLTGADLGGANLAGANLHSVDLAGADLANANLTGAKIKDDCILVGRRPVFQIGPIGSRCAYFAAYITDKGLRFDAGCQRQITREVFEVRLQDEHGDNIHAKEYKAALALIDIHAALWSADNKMVEG